MVCHQWMTTLSNHIFSEATRPSKPKFHLFASMGWGIESLCVCMCVCVCLCVRFMKIGSLVWLLWQLQVFRLRLELTPGTGCSKLTTSLVNVSLKFQTLIAHICQYFLSKKCEKLLQCKSFFHFVNKRYQSIWL